MAIMTVFDDNLTPVLSSNIDFSTLTSQPTPEEFFVLSRINGQLTIAQLCGVTGLGREKTLLALEKLYNVGLLSLSGAGSPAAAPKNNFKTEPEPDATPVERPAPNYDRMPILFSDFDFDQEILDQQVEIDDDIKREILFLFEQINDVDHYQLLGIPSDASKKEIRNAYFAFSRRFHPDLFFRRLLGDYEKRIEKLFQRTVKAYETLSHIKKRAAYDESLFPTTPLDDISSHADEDPNTLRSTESAQANATKKRDLAFTILVGRADAHAASLDWKRACEEYKNALRIKRDIDLALRIARTLFETRTETDQAFMFARAALKMDQDCIDALLILGELYQLIDAPDEALSYFRRALKIAPTRVDIHQHIEHLSG